MRPVADSAPNTAKITISSDISASSPFLFRRATASPSDHRGRANSWACQVARPRCCRLDFGGGFGFAFLDGGLERGVVELVLVGVGFGEVGDGLVELV